MARAETTQHSDKLTPLKELLDQGTETARLAVFDAVYAYVLDYRRSDFLLKLKKEPSKTSYNKDEKTKDARIEEDNNKLSDLRVTEAMFAGHMNTMHRNCVMVPGYKLALEDALGILTDILPDIDEVTLESDVDKLARGQKTCEDIFQIMTPSYAKTV